ncbi:hypothetical protein QBC34DRAFT_453893 [Podospora aff. communis PSN243]|uniref:J domain-containing protein n=1 Tax=Podospora aff. communis PSN243 TaxID=3040156 RepID=A0AAV9H779_9PEZI|nr:hypothetical protein QBC34DRAFT_453893 [Podospora aff. communis PSN243]
MSSQRSPKRRRVLSSFNPPEHHGDNKTDSHTRDRGDSPTPPNEATPDLATESTTDPSTAPRASKFRFKSERSRSSRYDRSTRDSHRSFRYDGATKSPHRDPDDRPRRHHRRRHHPPSDPSRPRKHRHRHRTHSPSPPAPNPFAPGPLDPDAAFRESLFDAMADDEGAAYWESVYGQPIHVYASERSRAGGELEGMTDEEYAAYVRQKMWEKTHAGLVEERERRKKAREERERREEEAERVRAEVERSLRRGEERRRKRGWKERWEGYRRRWEEWDGQDLEGIPWPVVWDERGEMAEEVRSFFVGGLALEEVGEKEFAARLKGERVRWHPDKMQQRLGGKVDAEVMKNVTTIFQVVDALWNDTRKNVG